MNKKPVVLLTGSSGYIGGRLVTRLVEKGYRIKCLVRYSESVEGRQWQNDVETVFGDVLTPGSLEQVMAGTDTEYYLIHLMASVQCKKNAVRKIPSDTDSLLRSKRTFRPYVLVSSLSAPRPYFQWTDKGNSKKINRTPTTPSQHLPRGFL